jgi:hypothetical protein
MALLLVAFVENEAPSLVLCTAVDRAQPWRLNSN